MDVSVEKLEGNQVQMTVTVPPEDVDEAVESSSVCLQANIPGFRKGKAPRRVLEMRFGKEAILAQALKT